MPRPDHHTVVALATPLAVGAVALTTGLGVAAMVKAFGIGFLARPRSDAAAGAREAPASMITGMRRRSAASCSRRLAVRRARPRCGACSTRSRAA